MNESSCAYEIIQETLQAAGNSLSVSSLCSMAGVSRSGYYAWLKAGPIREAQEQKDREDFDLVLEAYRMRGYSKGAKGIYMALLHMEPPVIMNLKKYGGSWTNTACHALCARQTLTGGWPGPSRPAA